MKIDKKYLFYGILVGCGLAYILTMLFVICFVLYDDIIS